MGKIFSFFALFLLPGFAFCQKDVVKPQGVVISEQVSSILKKLAISKVRVYEWFNDSNGFLGKSGTVDFQVNGMFLIVKGFNNEDSYLNFNRLTRFNVGDG